MKNRGDKYHKQAEEITSLISETFKTLRKFIEEKYKIIITKIRLSIILKLNVMFSLKSLNMLFALNILIILVYGYLTFDKINHNIDKYFVKISEYIFSSNEIASDKLEMIDDINSFNVIIYDSNNSIIYSSQYEGINNLSENSIKVKNNSYLKFKDSIDVENIQNNIVSIFNINYIYEKDLNDLGKDVIIQMEYNLYEEFKFLGIFILWIMIAEIVCVLLSLNKIASGSRKILRPLDEMTKTVKNITINEMNTRLNVSGSQNELKDLAITFNNMLDRIQEAYEIQNQFVSDASHELRTPIAVIQGYSRLLERWGKDDEQALEESIEAIKSEANSMKELVEKLLFLARGDKNTQEVNKERFHLDELIEEILKETKLIDNTHFITCDKNEVIEIYADSKLIKQAMRVFIDNSIKYTPEGGAINISSNKRNESVEIVIKDNGIGIDAKDIPKIFDRFYRSDKSRTRETGGNGLGLSIAKWIIKKHNGSIRVDSAINVGTRITFSLPLIFNEDSHT